MCGCDCVGESGSMCVAALTDSITVSVCGCDCVWVCVSVSVWV